MEPPFLHVTTRPAGELDLAASPVARAPGHRSQQVQQPAQSRQLAESCLERCRSSWEAIASTSATCQRNKAKASMQFGPGRAAVDHQRGWPEPKGGRAYLVQHQLSPSDLQSAHLGSLEFCPTLNSRGTWACNQNRCPQLASTHSLVGAT